MNSPKPATTFHVLLEEGVLCDSIQSQFRCGDHYATVSSIPNTPTNWDNIHRASLLFPTFVERIDYNGVVTVTPWKESEPFLCRRRRFETVTVD